MHIAPYHTSFYAILEGHFLRLIFKLVHNFPCKVIQDVQIDTSKRKLKLKMYRQ